MANRLMKLDNIISVISFYLFSCMCRQFACAHIILQNY